MDDGVRKEDNISLKMGASSNPNSTKIASLQERKKVLEETLTKHNHELRQLCIREAELTGVMPVEYPLEPGESTPSFRKRVGTSYQLPQNLINNINSQEEISALEVEMQILNKLSDAALILANENESNGNKTGRRKHMADYQHHKQRYNELEEKLHSLKMQVSKQPKQASPNINQQLKHKKKPRPLEQDDALSMNINLSDPFGKSFRHSLRSLQHPTIIQDVEYRYSVQSHQRLAYRSSDSKSLNEAIQQYDVSVPTFYRLSLNGYKDYVDRQENHDNLGGIMQNQYMQSQSSNNLYKQHLPQYINPSRTLPNISRRSPQSVTQAYSYQEFHKYNNNPHTSTNRQASPSTTSNSSVKYYPMQGPHNYKQYNSDHSFHNLNPHQIQPHQQYEHDVMTSGLGGYWKQSESGESFWCNSNNEANPKDKRFGSLDRRKNKRVQKRISPNVDPKSATIASGTSYHESSRTLPLKSQQVVSRHRQDNRQLVRTQSLGSVGGQTIDSVCPSDDSSCGSETLSFTEHNNIRKHKQKEWYETSLDGPVSSVSSISRSHSTVPSIAPEDKYIEFPPPLSSPHTPTQTSFPIPSTQPLKEIPAESNPSPRNRETNLEIFNNNIPKNGTVVQQGQWKPYHEETKPFEMSDFYKYSTKFKKAAQNVTHEESPQSRSPSVFRNLPLPSPQGNVPSNVNEQYDDDDNASVIQKGVYQPLQPMKCQAFSPVSNININNVGSPLSLNESFDLSPNVAENFSKEMNAWYQNHEHQTDNNNATLV